MEKDLGYWNWLTALGLLLVGLPLTALALGVVLRFFGLRRIGRACVLGGVGGYVGAATASFTSIGITFFTYIFHFWHFPQKEASESTGMFLAFLSVLVVIPLAGLVAGGVYGVFVGRRVKAPEA